MSRLAVWVARCKISTFGPSRCPFFLAGEMQTNKQISERVILQDGWGCGGMPRCWRQWGATGQPPASCRGWGRDEARRALEVPTAALGPSSQPPGPERLPPASLSPQQQAPASQWERFVPIRSDGQLSPEASARCKTLV